MRMPLSRVSTWIRPWSALLAGVGASCSILHLKHEVQAIAAHGVVALQVAERSPAVTTYAVAWVEDTAGKPTVIALQPIGSDGLAYFLLRVDRRYHIGAFTDLDGDRVYDGGEPAASRRFVAPLPLDQTQAQATPLALVLDPQHGLPPGQAVAVPDTESDQGDAVAVHIGDVVTLDDPRFSEQNSDRGMWRPFEFLQEIGIGLYQLEPYDPGRLPVLFVHGISGGPQDWRWIVEHLDRSRFQPWVFQYPSGFRIERIAGALATGLATLQRRHGFARMAIVAHSMGGLVSRGAIQRLAAQTGQNFVPRFVSISTPWAGHEAAAKGVDHLNYPVPSWRDMVPGSDYLRSILEQPLPAGTRHDLLFSFKTSGGMGMPNDNDGVVGVASQLEPGVQEAAHSLFGLPLGHTEILASPLALRRVEHGLLAP
jgi:pimeloyl-ACP methyl ester carboxylesterase